MEEWEAYYKQYETLILFIAAWLLSIPTGIFINRLDAYLKNRSKTTKAKEIITRYAEVRMYRRNRLPLPESEFKTLSPTMKIMALTFVIMMIQSFSSEAVTDVYGKNVSNLYFWITLSLTLLLNTAVIVHAEKDYSIFHDAVYLSEYREKTIAKLAQLGYGSRVLDKIDKEIEVKA